MYDEAALKAILQRAMELDASRATVPPEEIVHIAAELGISESAVREALQERENTASLSVARHAAPSQTSASRILALSSGGGILAGILTSGAVVSPIIGTVIVGAGLLPGLIMVSGGLALTERSRSLLTFLRRNTAVWLGYGIGWSLWSQLFPVQIGGAGSVRMSLMRAAMAFALTTCAGIVFLVIQRIRGAAAATGGPGDTGGGVFRRIARRLKKTIQELLSPRVNRSAVAQLTLRAIRPVL